MVAYNNLSIAIKTPILILIQSHQFGILTHKIYDDELTGN